MTAPGNVRASSSAASRTCDNPDCVNRVAWSNRPGRPQTFCSPSCRQRARHAASRLRADLQSLERKRSSAELNYRQRRDVDAELAHKRWLLSSYPASFQP